TAVGFKLVGGKPLIDADKPAMEKAVRQFGQAIRGGAVGLFYYAGHGIQVKGQNYLIPVTANVNSETDVKYELVDAGYVLDEMANAGNRLNIMILDACRNNPFGGRGLRSTGAGLAQVSAPSGTVIGYATQPGNTALDGFDGNSPYTQALAQAIKTPGLDIFATFNKVGLLVKKATGGEQQPWLATSPVEGRFQFAGDPPPDDGPGDAVQTPGKGAFDVGDLERNARQEQDAWATWQTEMQGAFERVTGLSGETRQREGWKRFLQAYAQNNPYSEDDETLRQDANKRMQALEARAGTTPPPPPSRGGTEPVTGMEFVAVPGGTFEMGCGAGQSDCAADQKPAHRVSLGGFELGKHEVTQGQWRAVMGSNPADFGACGDNCPVEQVSWDDVQGFLARLNGRGDRCRYRLPTEAEWEYACRSGGRPEQYCGGSDGDRLAWHDGNSGGETHPVGTKAPNGLGLYDMSGNVWEWVADWYGDSYYAGSPRDNPPGPPTGSARVRRGGSWLYGPANAQSAVRDRDAPGSRYDGLGVRLARTCP
ncbi:MAG: SUMF1/EgtB/PvdO family nonheme iron enzyme, partial [Magnetococcales bacterium]|nr:SUMF1/EgtB/PvdO family nonheme iron enzyme [Magnetococcales bacterium]